MDVRNEAKVRRNFYPEFPGMYMFGRDNQRDSNHSLRFLCPHFGHQKAID